MTERMGIPSAVLDAYSLVGCHTKSVTTGWINRTVICVDGDRRLVLQRLHPIFAPEVNLDLEAIARHLAGRGILSPQLVRTDVGDAYVIDADGRCWRALTFIEGRTYDRLDEKRARSAGALVARFHRGLADLDHTFRFERSGTHDTTAHLGKLARLVEARARDGRMDEIEPIANDILTAGGALDAAPELPVRIIHGDLKATNLMFDDACAAVAIVDLDTLAHDTIAVELGDALRSWCNRTNEADPDAHFDALLFEAAVSGFAENANGVFAGDERRAIVSGAERIALELASRFAADLYEDSYFGWDETRFATRTDHNLARCHAQLALARSVREQRAELEAIVSRAFDG